MRRTDHNNNLLSVTSFRDEKLNENLPTKFKIMLIGSVSNIFAINVIASYAGWQARLDYFIDDKITIQTDFLHLNVLIKLEKQNWSFKCTYKRTVC